MKTIILGPPGTGKTTTLLNLVDEFIQDGIRPKQIGYFSFTKKAANEAADRAAEKFGLDKENDLPFFRTLHSYAFNQLGMSKEKMMKTEDYREFGQKCGIPIKTAKYSNEDGTFNVYQVNSPYRIPKGFPLKRIHGLESDTRYGSNSGPDYDNYQA